MAALRIFVGYEDRQAIAYEVLKYSLEKHSSSPLDIRPLRLRALEEEIGFKRPHDPLQSTEFTYTRFLVPLLCEFKGRALYLDSDMLCLADVTELFDLDLSVFWLRVVKHEHHPTTRIKMGNRIQTDYPRKNWSSLMLLDCERLTCWSKEMVESQSGRWLHRFEPIPDESIGELPRTWNVLDFHDESTKLVHYTEGGPWLPECATHPYGALWRRYRDELEHNRGHPGPWPE
jgi:lipopolysaccharide biosynthesis glycosyltransferase